ncbi:Microcystin-dependent protein [Nocardioides exalbidus]|uniref:Microcystin-dependent protein n=1 Tax=Nocardioides exalbidus TaxID=402596 RepID=A0A1H4K8X7_9ACTN|nr:tail fiber protein [Nocardioides exalbidus]SEB54994.1 Microcystin-dependent protein [Nocardioides exalbidus]
MGQPYVGELRMFAGNFPPMGWMFCEGQVLPISENQTLFTLIGTTYGGDGQSTFALPDLRGRLPMHAGTSQGGTTHTLAETGGVEEVTLTANQVPAHSHGLPVSSTAASSRSAVGGVPAATAAEAPWATAGPTEAMTTSTAAGGSQPHTNMQPYLCVNFIISLFGVFPPQS